MAELKKDWALTREGFLRLLHWLDNGIDSDGERYLEVRHRLVLYFDRKGCPSADDLADYTLNRVARRLEEQGHIADLSPLHYCYITAKFVFLEYLRGAEHSHTSFDNARDSGRLPSSLTAFPHDHDQAAVREEMFDCLEQCLNKLLPSDKELILEYYQGEQRTKIERRSTMSVRLGITANALAIRACRIRSKLEVYFKTCSRKG